MIHSRMWNPPHNPKRTCIKCALHVYHPLKAKKASKTSISLKEYTVHVELKIETQLNRLRLIGQHLNSREGEAHKETKNCTTSHNFSRFLTFFSNIHELLAFHSGHNVIIQAIFHNPFPLLPHQILNTIQALYSSCSLVVPSHVHQMN